MAKYSGTSPYSATTIVDEQYLDILRPRTVPSSSDDFLYTIESQYSRRPDLLAFDLYGSPKLWWVFAQRNPDTLQDPIFDKLLDFRGSTKIPLLNTGVVK